MTWRVIHGDCLEQLRELAAESIDSVVCDPPYDLEFMGRSWDGTGVAFKVETWAEALRVLKPGGHLLAFGGTRTYHRMVCAIEDAGFEIRDTICWLYGSGFPKSLDVSKAIDKAAGVEREVVGERLEHDITRPEGGGDERLMTSAGARETRVVSETAPATPEAAQWEGWGTALKPAHEPIVVARKPLGGTVASNVLEHGTGPLNVDGCRVDVVDEGAYERNHSGDRGHDGTRPVEGRGATDLRPGGGRPKRVSRSEDTDGKNTYGSDGPGGGSYADGTTTLGRWPANVVLDEEASGAVDEQSGELVSGANPTRRGSDKFREVYGDFTGQEACDAARGIDRGGASRFFYCPKTSRAERNAGLEGFAERPGPSEDYGTKRQHPLLEPGRENKVLPVKNHHPTVKPVELMRWLVRLVTPPGGTVLDPFAGSGTTGVACVLEGLDFVGVEREAEYVEIAQARIGWWAERPAGVAVDEALEAEGQRQKVREAGQEALFS